MQQYSSDIPLEVSALGGVYVPLVTCIQELVAWSLLEFVRLGCYIIPPFSYSVVLLGSREPGIR